MSGDHNMNQSSYGDGTVFRGERSADSEVPTIDWQVIDRGWRSAYEHCYRITSELQNTVHKQAQEIERLRHLVSNLRTQRKTYRSR